MNDAITPDNTEPRDWVRRGKDLLERSVRVQEMMKLFEDQEFLIAAQKLTGITDVNEAVPVLVAVNARLANMDHETASTIISALAESVLSRNAQKPLNELQSSAQAELGVKTGKAWNEATQKMYVETLAKNKIPIKPLTPAPAPKI